MMMCAHHNYHNITNILLLLLLLHTTHQLIRIQINLSVSDLYRDCSSHHHHHQSLILWSPNLLLEFEYVIFLLLGFVTADHFLSSERENVRNKVIIRKKRASKKKRLFETQHGSRRGRHGKSKWRRGWRLVVGVAIIRGDNF